MDNLQFVEFDQYCKDCKYEELSQDLDPCHECLSVPAREGSIKPERYEEKEKRK